MCTAGGSTNKNALKIELQLLDSSLDEMNKTNTKKGTTFCTIKMTEWPSLSSGAFDSHLIHCPHRLCFSAFHSTGYGECLLNEPESRPYSLPLQLPGLLYNVNKQCELIFGPGSQVCPYMVSIWGPFLPS